MGWLLAYCSVLLVSAAQLLLKWAMVRLPAIGDPSAFFTVLFSLVPAVQALLAGLLAYALSMLCWLLALQRIALSRAIATQPELSAGVGRRAVAAGAKRGVCLGQAGGRRFNPRRAAIDLLAAEKNALTVLLFSPFIFSEFQ